MGLDMYLSKRTYIGRSYKHVRDRMDRNGETIKLEGKCFTGIDIDRIDYIIEGVAYWRKANAIHRWFVENVQKDRDDCGDYWVGEDKLRELLDTVNKVLESTTLVEGNVENGASVRMINGAVEKTPHVEPGMVLQDTSIANELLPPQSGFFFGSTNLDQWYWEDLLYTKQVIESLLDEPGDGDFWYHSSW